VRPAIQAVPPTPYQKSLMHLGGFAVEITRATKSAKKIKVALQQVYRDKSLTFTAFYNILKILKLRNKLMTADTSTPRKQGELPP